MVRSIPQMHQHLEHLNIFFHDKTSALVSIISKHPGRYTPQDYSDFTDLIEQIRNDALSRINQFFRSRHAEKTQIYDSQITSYTENGDQTSHRLAEFRQQLEEATIQLKKEQCRKQNLMDSFSKKFSENIVLKKAWRLMKKYHDQRIRAKELDHKMDEVYRHNLLKKAFFPWRTLTYKQGYEGTVRRQTQKDIACIHEQYQSIINILKGKIQETDEMIRVKKAAKGQFAFSLSKNLLKTISNLSLQVMSLNQMALRDGQVEEIDTRHFMANVDMVIGQKLNKVKDYKRTLLGQQQEGKRKKKITFA